MKENAHKVARIDFELSKILRDCLLPGRLPAMKFWSLEEKCVTVLPISLHLGASLQVIATHPSAQNNVSFRNLP